MLTPEDEAERQVDAQRLAEDQEDRARDGDRGY